MAYKYCSKAALKNSKHRNTEGENQKIRRDITDKAIN